MLLKKPAFLQIPDQHLEHRRNVAELFYNTVVRDHYSDHDHLTGQYKGAAHSICNLTYQNPKFIPIVCHNLSGYDAHLFIKQFGNDDNDIKLLANNEEGNTIKKKRASEYRSAVH